MERDLDSLVALCIAGLCGIGYGLRQIIEAQARAGAKSGQIVISGGAGRSDLIRQLLADATGVRLAAPRLGGTRAAWFGHPWRGGRRGL